MSKRPLAEVFDHVDTTSRGCWVWTRRCLPNGYGRFREGYAHRTSYELVYGPLTDGVKVLHHCDNPPCIRPSHLFSGTQKDNMQDCLKKGRFSPRGLLTSDTHCYQGHERTALSTYVDPRGYRRCRICRILSRQADGKPQVTEFTIATYADQSA